MNVRFCGLYEDIRVFRGRLEDSLEASLFRIFKEFGYNESLMRESDYAKRYMKISRYNNTIPKLELHLKKMFLLFKRIRKKGFLLRLRKGDPVIFLKEPFWKTRFGGEFEKLEGPEIWQGVAVCACLSVLNRDKVRVIWGEDKFPGRGDCFESATDFKLNP